MENKTSWQCRWSPTLGELESTHQKTWGTVEYVDPFRPTVFFGLYGLPDFYSLWRHKGKKAILWAGSDIRHFVDGYWLDDKGIIKINPESFAKWISENCDSYVENFVEREELKKLGIFSTIIPSFLGNVDDYEITYKQSKRPSVYVSVSGDDFELYRWQEALELAGKHRDIDFHFYGNSKPLPISFHYPEKYTNVFFHGRVPKKQMNEEIEHMQGALRLLPFEGFSEIIAKSVLWGQWPISRIPYPHTLPVEYLEKLVNMKKPNIEGRKYYKNKLNEYPWNSKK